MKTEPMDHKVGIATRDALNYILAKKKITEDDFIKNCPLPEDILKDALHLSCCNIQPEELSIMCTSLELDITELAHVTNTMINMEPEIRHLLICNAKLDDISKKKVLNFARGYIAADNRSDEDLQKYVKESFEKEGLPEPEINPNIRIMY